MEPFEEPIKSPTPMEQVDELISKVVNVFFRAVSEGDLETVKILHDEHHKIKFDAWTDKGMTALQVACEKNHKELVEWLINEAQAGLDVVGIQGFRAIHYAVQR